MRLYITIVAVSNPNGGSTSVPTGQLVGAELRYSPQKYTLARQLPPCCQKSNCRRLGLLIDGSRPIHPPDSLHQKRWGNGQKNVISLRVYDYIIIMYIYIYVTPWISPWPHFLLLRPWTVSPRRCWLLAGFPVGPFGMLGIVTCRWCMATRVEGEITETTVIIGWWFQPLWKIGVRQMGWWNSQYMEK